ncbi:DUF6282 family protein [Devosia sp. YIM 151766]|uniref:DUF6282 family protein n=1 Tax=Devosia sp. YIM 151766 TaxID=3017325 RepID=UPI00255C9497|nr:DUF6282 family protein [Devosia sp. YIM 151766]WIY53164.1 DUF6282 family protein [Devosia sp. YIM 151766]
MGAVDLHCHSGPSVMERGVSHIDMMRAAREVGMRALCFKDHYYTTAPAVKLIQAEFPQDDVALLGSIVLNNAAGGFNPYALDIALKLGARVVWMPTASAANHIRQSHRKKRLQTATPMLPPEGLDVLDSRGRIRDDVKQVLDLIARADAVLSAGHLHISEIWPLFEEAKSRGVQRLVVAHPTYVIGADLADIKELAGLGAVLEHSICMFIDCPSRQYEPSFLKAVIDAGGIDSTILSSDMGQKKNPHPIDGFRAVIRMCRELGYAEDDIRKLIGSNAARLAGLTQEGKKTI